MHILETYALNCGAKINKPFIYTTFFPLPIKKYITFHSDEPEPAKNYEYWQDVINLINPFLLKEGISIVHVGEKGHRNFSDCVDLLGQTNQNQLAYVLHNSMLHFGPEGFLTHLASSLDIPLVAIYGISYVSCVRPFFGTPSKQTLITAYDRTDKKPSFAADENPRTVNLVKPEEIANAILKALNIKVEIPFDTVFIGNKYSSFIIEESIPNTPALLFNPEHQVEIRADLEYDDNSFLQQLGNYKKAIIVVDKQANLTTLTRFRDHINAIVVKIVDDTQRAFVARLQELGRNLILISDLPEQEIQKLKPLYYEFGNINPLERVSEDKINELKKDLPMLFYRSSKVTASNGKYYYSKAAADKDIPMSNHHEYQRVLDVPSFWENLHCFTIVRQKPLDS